MISKTKKTVYGVLFAGSLALLVPTLLEARKADPLPPPLELPAEGEAPLQAQPAVEERTTASESVAASDADRTQDREHAPTRSPPTASVGPTGALERLEQSLARLESFSSSATLAPSRRGPRARVAGQDVSVDRSPTARPSAGDSLADDTSRHRAPDAGELETFLASAPLCGIVIGAEDRAAMFGGRIVRAGDALCAEASVKSIHARGVLLDCDGREHWVLLPPVQTRAARGTESGEGDGETSAGDAPTDASSAPQLDVTTPVANAISAAATVQGQQP